MTSVLPAGRQINLQLGWPSPHLFPAASLSTSASAVLTDFDASTAALVYGPSRGHALLRSSLAQWLGRMYYRNPDEIPESRVCIAGGASQNLGSILLKFTDSMYTRSVWMVEPTYFLACPIFEDCGLAGKLRGVPEDEEGIDIAFLRAGLARAEDDVLKEGGIDSPRFKTSANGYKKTYKHIIYVVPTFSNPSGKVMSLQRRHELVRLAIEFDALVISDDVYDFLRWPMEKDVMRETEQLSVPPRLVDINRSIDPESKSGNTVSNGSFSKIIAPGVRVSWAEGAPAFVTELALVGSSISGGNPGHLASTLVEKMLSSGALENHINVTLIPTYASRYHAMVDAITEYLEPLGVRIITGKPYPIASNMVNGSTTTPTNVVIHASKEFHFAGGFFLCISVPEEYCTAPYLAKTALEEHDLKVAHGKMFEVKGDVGSTERAKSSFGNTLRLCWSFHDELTICDGIKRLRTIMVESKGKQIS